MLEIWFGNGRAKIILDGRQLVTDEEILAFIENHLKPVDLIEYTANPEEEWRAMKGDLFFLLTTEEEERVDVYVKAMMTGNLYEQIKRWCINSGYSF